MADFLRRHVLLITWLVLLVSATQLMNASVEDPEFPRLGAKVLNSAFTPLQKAHHEIVETTRYLWSHYVWLVNVESERNDLFNRIKELEARNSKLIEFSSENSRLRKLLSFQEGTGFEGVAADIIGRDPSNWVRTVMIDRGEVDGLKPGMPVVDGNAVVGHTTAVSHRSARVLLLTDSSSAIDVIVQSSRATGVVEGRPGTDMLKLRYVLKLDQYRVRPGDRVICSGLDGVFPKGTLVGVIHSVGSGGGGMFQEIEVIPSVDLNRLENVLVLIPGQVDGIAKTLAKSSEDASSEHEVEE